MMCYQFFISDPRKWWKFKSEISRHSIIWKDLFYFAFSCSYGCIRACWFRFILYLLLAGSILGQFTVYFLVDVVRVSLSVQVCLIARKRLHSEMTYRVLSEMLNWAGVFISEMEPGLRVSDFGLVRSGHGSVCNTGCLARFWVLTCTFIVALFLQSCTISANHNRLHDIKSRNVVTSQETETTDINLRFRFLVTSWHFWIWRHLGYHCFFVQGYFKNMLWLQ